MKVLAYKARTELNTKIVELMADVCIRVGLYKDEVAQFNKAEILEIQDKAFKEFCDSNEFLTSNSQYFEHVRTFKNQFYANRDLKDYIGRFDSIYITTFFKDELFYILPQIMVSEVIAELNFRELYQEEDF